MLDAMYKLSDLTIFLIIVIVTTVLSVVAILISKRLFLHKLSYDDNLTVAGVSSLVGIIYGVLVGFIALYLINNNDHASNAVQREANAAANVYRESQWLKEPLRGRIDQNIEAYLNNVINIEWPAMKTKEQLDVGGDTFIHQISTELRSFVPTTPADVTILQELLGEVKNLYNARHERINMNKAGLSPEIWEVILVGTILIIAITHTFRTTFYLHLFSISAFSIMAASMLFLLVTLDRPFQGEFIVSPDALRAVFTFIQQSKMTVT